MFWANNYASSPHIEALLNKEDVTLQELMDEDDILQECKSQNKKLLDFLTKPEIMDELVLLITKEPSTDLEEKWRYKYPNIACELLTCDVSILNEKLAGDTSLLAKLYSFIDTDQPLNPLLASFFSKTIGILVVRKSEQVLEFLKSRQRCVDLLLQHLETSAIMDLVLKLVSQVEGSDMRQNILNWLDSQQLVQRLVKLLSTTSEPSKHANATQLLCDMVTVARENHCTSTERNENDPILNTLESEEIVNLILETVLTGEKLESSIVGGIQVLLALLGPKHISDQKNKSFVAGDELSINQRRTRMANATLLYLEQLHNLLLDPPYKPAVRTTAGVLECPLGNTRLHVAKLFMALLSTENVKIHETLAYLGTFQTLLDLFFQYSWNNFLHTQVQHCLASAINCDYQGSNSIIYVDIFVKGKLLDRIVDAFDRNENKQNKENRIRQGYMGHLINIANNIVTQCEKSFTFDRFLKTNLLPECLSKWENLVTTQLAEINNTNQIVLGGQTPAYMSNSEENSDDYNSYSQGAFIQQMYNTYQGQQMTATFVDNFGYHDDEFNDNDDALHNSVEQLTTLAFNLSEEDLDKRRDMFNEICQQKQNAGLEDGGGGAEWGDEGELTFQTVVDKRDWPSKQLEQDSSSSDEDGEDPRDLHMEIDATDLSGMIKFAAWGSSEPLSSKNITSDVVHPWGAPAEPVESTGWANFDDFENSLSIENTNIADIKSSEDVKQETLVLPESTNEKSSESEEQILNTDSIETKSTDTVQASPTVSDANFNKKNSNERKEYESVNSVNTADNNANTNEILIERKFDHELKTKPEDSVKTPRQIENSSDNLQEISKVKNELPEAALTSTDSK